MTTKAMRPSHAPAFAAPLAVDALAATSLPSGTRSSDDLGSANELDTGAFVAPLGEDDALLAAAVSRLEGNEWGGGVVLLDAATLEQLCQLSLNAGVSALAWGGADRDVLCCGCDDGDIVLARLATDVDFTFVPLDQADGDEDGQRETWGHDDIVTGVSASAVEKTLLASSSWDLTCG